MRVEPASAGSGITFVIDGRRVAAVAEQARESELATVLTDGVVSVSTVEHILAALFALGISNADIVLDGPEIPIVDGCSAAFVDAIRAAGIEMQDAARATFTLDTAFEVRDGGRAVIVLPADAFRVRFVADYPAPIGTHYRCLDIDAETFSTQLAPARTFAFLRDVEAMRARGLARGGSLENALVFSDDGPMTPLRWSDEVVRHKMLDLVGDFALLGAWPQIEIVAIKSGHALHARVTRELRKRIHG